MHVGADMEESCDISQNQQIISLINNCQDSEGSSLLDCGVTVKERNNHCHCGAQLLSPQQSLLKVSCEKGK